jgi:hypothetical protein
MLNGSRTHHDAGADQVLSRVKLSDVYHDLTGESVKFTGSGHWRAVAHWRGGKQLSVSGDDTRGVWKDHVSGDRGGVLDLIVRVNGGTKQEALRWAAELAGVALEDKPQSPGERAAWVRERQRVERSLPRARWWQSAMIGLTEELLHTLKLKLQEPVIVDLGVGEIYRVEQFLQRLRRLDGAELVAEFDSWITSSPVFSEALIRCGREREHGQLISLREYFNG